MYVHISAIGQYVYVPLYFLFFHKHDFFGDVYMYSSAYISNYTCIYFVFTFVYFYLTT